MLRSIRRKRRALSAAGFACALLPSAGARAAPSPSGPEIVRLLGPRARAAFAPKGAPGMGALVRLPVGVGAADLGLLPIAPGFGRLWGEPSNIMAFASAHPGLSVEVAPPLHLSLDTAGVYVTANASYASGYQGAHTLVGIADTGIDLTHPDFLDSNGGTRVAWLLDLSSPAIGKYPDLERQYGATDASGNLIGAVWAKADIDALLASGPRASLPGDDVGHGTLVAACAAASDPRYRGVAPGAGLLVARVTDAATGAIGNDELLRGVAFLFDRADAMGLPVVVNLSSGSDFGPHDGTLAWEQVLAGYVGAGHPGHALVAAAGNSGSIVEASVHQTIHVSTGAPVRVPVVTGGAENGGVQIWVATRASAALNVGLDGPDGPWIAPVAPGSAGGKDGGDYNAGVYNGSKAEGSPVPAASSGAVVIWQGKWPTGTYAVTFSGYGTADLYVQPTGDASIPGVRDVGFADGVRESTVNLPATHPEIIGVGCTINKASWVDVDHVRLGLQAPGLDGPGGEPDPLGSYSEPVDGEPCWFSGAGPTVTGVFKPEIMAPGAAIVGAMSQQALPPAPLSIFTNPDCPPVGDAGVTPTDCQEVDALHAASFGTSFSAPLVAGAVAVLFERDPTLTQDQVLAALQGGAHRLRGPARFEDQAGAGELDVMGALRVLDAGAAGTTLPARSASWMTLGGDVYLADGSTPMSAVFELRGAAGAGGGEAPAADGFDADRLVAYAEVDGAPRPEAVTLARRGPGVWIGTVRLPAGLGGERLTVGARFDGVDVVDPRTVPIAADLWSAEYPARVLGGCAVAAAGARSPWSAAEGWAAALIAAAALDQRRRARALTRGRRGEASTGSSGRPGRTSHRSGRGRT